MALAIVFGLADIGLLFANYQGDALPLLAVFALLIANRVVESRGGASVEAGYSSLPYHASLLLFCALFFLPQFGADLASFAFGAAHKAHPPAACAVRFEEPRLAALVLCDRPDEMQKSSNGSVYATYVNEGARLLRQQCGRPAKVLTMDSQNPFPYALGWPPPRGGMACSGFFTDEVRPSFDAYFGDATVVMVPKHPAQAPIYIEPLNRIYTPALLRRFYLAAETDWWRLYKRK